MTEVESTPEMAELLYQRMAARLAVVRSRLRAPLTLADKLLLGHLEDPAGQELKSGKAT